MPPWGSFEVTWSSWKASYVCTTPVTLNHIAEQNVKFPVSHPLIINMTYSGWCWNCWSSAFLEIVTKFWISSVQFSRSVMSDSLQPNGSQHARPPCPSPSLAVHSDSCPSSLWCHPAISSWVVPFSSCPHSSQHQSLFQWVNSSHEVSKVLEFQL